MRTIRTRPKEFGQLLCEARKARRMTQGELAARLRIGQQAVSRWEHGSSRPEPQVLASVASIFTEHHESVWRTAAGYQEARQDKRASPSPRLKPVRPLLETLPLHQLTFKQF